REGFRAIELRSNQADQSGNDGQKSTEKVNTRFGQSFSVSDGCTQLLLCFRQQEINFVVGYEIRICDLTHDSRQLQRCCFPRHEIIERLPGSSSDKFNDACVIHE